MFGRIILIVFVTVSDEIDKKSNGSYTHRDTHNKVPKKRIQ